MQGKRLVRNALHAAAIVLSLSGSAQAAGGKLEGNDREHGYKMLEVVQDDLRKHHMDPSLGGGRQGAVFEAAKRAIAQAETYDQLFGAIARAVQDLDDPHTFFAPPARAVRIDHGWNLQMIGDRCLVTAVKAGSDAHKKGLRPGDAVLTVDGITMDRKSLLKLNYLYHVVTPRRGMRIQAQTGTAPPRILDAMAEVRQIPLVQDPFISDVFLTIRRSQNANAGEPRQFEVGNKALIWQPGTLEMDDKEIDGWIKKAQKRPALVLDLRGNPGGEAKPLLRLVGSLLDHDLKVGEYKLRDKTEPLLAKSRGKSAFTGTLVVLVDSETASTAEVLARVIQLEKRGAVIGDRTAGSVRQSRGLEHRIGSDPVWEYSVHVTTGDLQMSDGQSPEGTGVAPDPVALPSPEDLAAGRDPVLAKALELAGAPVTAEEAGKMLPYQWPSAGDKGQDRAGLDLPNQKAGASRSGASGASGP